MSTVTPFPIQNVSAPARSHAAVELAVAVGRLQRQAMMGGFEEEAFLLSLVVRSLEDEAKKK